MSGSSLDCYFGYSRFVIFVNSLDGSPSGSCVVPQVCYITIWLLAVQRVLFCLKSLFHIYLVPPLVQVLVQVVAPPLVYFQIQVSFVSADIC